MKSLFRLTGWLFVWLGDQELRAQIRILEEERESLQVKLRISELENDTLVKVNRRNHDRVQLEIQQLGGMPMKPPDGNPIA
jgi:hypothetical protein